MPISTFVSESYGSLLADLEVPCVIIQFHGFANYAEFTGLMNQGLAYYQDHSRLAQRWGWVADVRQMGAIPIRVQEWLVNDWNPRAHAAGILEISIVVSENVFGQIGTQQYVKNTENQSRYTLASIYYPSLEAAKKGAQQSLSAQG